MKKTTIFVLLSLIAGCTNSKSTRNYSSESQAAGVCENSYSKNLDISSVEKEAVPCFIEPPLYPRLAATEGIEGYVKFEFDILTDGKVANVKVLEAEPKGIFEYGARKALKNWIFRVASEEGKPVIQKDMIYTMIFQLGR